MVFADGIGGRETRAFFTGQPTVAGSSLNSALKKGNRTCAILNLSFLESDCFWCPDLSRDEGAPTDPI